MTGARAGSRTAARFIGGALLALTLVTAHAQGRPGMPETTGTRTSSMDAPDSNRDLQSYQHAPSVQWMARHLGLSTAQAARDFEDFNSGVLILAVLYLALRYVPGMLRRKRATIEHDLVRAHQATADAEARTHRMEGRLAALGGEIEALRQQAAASTREEEGRIRASIEAERERILHSAEAEIRAMQVASERGLRRYAAELAVRRAAQRMQLTPEGDQALIDEFLQSLGGVLGKERN